MRTSNLGQKGISYLGPRTWNKLLSEIKSAESVNTFKHEVKKKFFEDLKRKDDDIYVYYWSSSLSDQNVYPRSTYLFS